MLASAWSHPLKSPWFWFCIAFGIFAKIAFIEHMEWKGDELIMWNWVADALNGEAWPQIGMESGVIIRNAGLSVWSFISLGHIVQAVQGSPLTPVDLARGVAVSNSIALLLMIALVLYRITPAERSSWFWGIALYAVNPFSMIYQRKIWAQSILPIFCVFFLWAWFLRNKKFGAFAWGFVGAILGQIHMSGYAFALALVLWVLIFDRKSVSWWSWFWGSCLGSVGLLPWLVYLYDYFRSAPTGLGGFSGWGEAVQLRFWVFWLTEPLGLHLGNIVGVKNGNGLWEQLREFAEFPIIAGQATYIGGVAQALCAVTGAMVLLSGVTSLFRPEGSGSYLKRLIVGGDATGFSIRASILCYGGLLTASGALIFRFYLMITNPLTYVGWARWAGLDRPFARRAYAALVVSLILLTATLMTFIVTQGGAPNGSYGYGYWAQKELGKSNEGRGF